MFVKSTKELIMGFRKKQDVYSPLHINREMVERVQIPVHACFRGPLIGDKHHLTSQEAQKKAASQEDKPVVAAPGIILPLLH